MFSNKELRRLLVPLMIEQVLVSLMGTVDTMMVTSVGSAAISAVALVDSINVLLIYIFTAMATGGSIICAQQLGRGQPQEAQETGRQLVLTVLVLSCAAMIVLILFRRPLLLLIFGSVEAAVMQNSVVYLLITALSYPFIALYNAGAALFRTCGNSRLPMLVSTACNIVNIALNAILIFILDMGVAGVAIGTLVSRILCALTVLAALRRPRQSIVLREYLRIRPDFRRIRRIMSIGIPTGIENGMFQLGKLAVQSTLATLSTTAIAAHTMACTIEALSSRPALGIGIGLMTVVGQCIGANRIDEAVRYIRKLTLYSEAAIILCCAFTALIVAPLTRLTGMEPEAAELAQKLTYLIAIVKVFVWTPAFTPASGMRAAGDVRCSVLVSTAATWICRAAVAAVLVRTLGFGPLGIWIGVFADWTARAVFYAFRTKNRKWLRHSVLG